MTENDYIAEYVKEKHSSILGFDFAIWKFGKQMIKISQDIVDAFNAIDWNNVDMEKLKK